MKASITILLFLSIAFSKNSYSQSTSPDQGNLHFHFGSIMVYNTFSVGYESFNLLKNSKRHQFRPLLRAGMWNSSFSNKNTGVHSSIGIAYLFGKKNHFIEHSSEFVTHFDKGLKGQTIVYIGALYRPYLGYRYQPSGKRIIAKIGLGWREVIQVGIGLRLY
nr:hypothetical protein [uncultured Brumimicrobium sp.]